MEPTVVDTVNLTALGQPHALSLIDLVLQADWVVKTVVLMLILASVWSWTIIFTKLLTLRRFNARADVFEGQFWSGGSLDALFDKIGDAPRDPMASVFATGMREWRHAANLGLMAKTSIRDSLQARIEREMAVTARRELARAEASLTYLASIGSTAPFVGLFGTVWGIMNSFSAIAGSNNTSLAVVAPGIAEALFATALGLLTAVPAVVAYNKFASDLARFSERIDLFCDEFSGLLSRHLEERAP